MTHKDDEKAADKYADARKIPGYPGYLITRNGVVWSMKRKAPVIKKPRLDKDGYWRVGLSMPGWKSVRNVGIHQLIARAFHGEPKYGQVVRHLDGTKTNNLPENLAWGTHSENIRDTILHGTNTGPSNGRRGAVKLRKSVCLRGHSRAGHKPQQHCRECSREKYARTGIR